MKTVVPFSFLMVVILILCVAAEPPRARLETGDYRDLVATNSQWAEAIKRSKVPTAEEAVRKSFGLLRDARSSVAVNALLRLARADTDLGAVGDFVWEVRVMWGSDIADVIWVSASTGKARDSSQPQRALTPLRTPVLSPTT